MAFNNWKMVESEFGRTSPRITIAATSTADAVYDDILPLVGGWQSQGGHAQYIVPSTFADIQNKIGGGFPQFQGLYCNHTKQKFILGTDAGGTGYQLVEVEFEFGELQEWTTNDNCQSAIISTELSIEGLALPQGSFTWTSGTNSGNPLDPDKDIQPQLWLPFVAIEVNFAFKPTLPLQTFNDNAGMVNSANVTIAGVTFSAGQLLFQGVQSEPSTSVDGSIGWSRVIKFAARQDDWNKVYSPADGTFESVTPNLYDTGDLNDVLTS